MRRGLEYERVLRMVDTLEKNLSALYSILESNLTILEETLMSIFERSSYGLQKLSNIFFENRQPRPIKVLTSDYFILVLCSNKDSIKSEISELIKARDTDPDFQAWLEERKSKKLDINVTKYYLSRLKFDIEFDSDLVMEVSKVEASTSAIVLERKTRLYDSLNETLGESLAGSLNFQSDAIIQVFFFSFKKIG